MLIKKTDLIILGAGISGLSAARMAEEMGVPYILLEKAPLVGGLTRSVCLDDYVFDYTGHLLHLAYYKSPEELGKPFDNNDWMNITRNAKCYYRGALIDAPFQYHLGQLPESTAEKFYSSYLQALSKRKKCVIRTFRDYLINNFGEEMAHEFLIPYNEKLLATSVNRISHNAVTRFFPPPAKNKIDQGMTEKNGSAGSSSDGLYNSSFWYPKRNGIQTLVDGLKTGVSDANLELSITIEKIDLQKHLVHTSRGMFGFDNLISSIPFNVFSKLCGLAENLASEELSDLSAASVLSINLGIRGKLNPKYENVHWIYFSEKQIPFYRVGFYSNFSKNPNYCIINTIILSQ